VTGTASALGKTQMFEGSVYIPRAGAHLPDGPRFQAVPEYEPATLRGQGGGNFSYKFWAYNDSKAWMDKEVYCYITSISYPCKNWWSRAPPDHLNGAYVLTTNETGGMTVNSCLWSGGHMTLCFESLTGAGVEEKQANGSYQDIGWTYYSEDIGWLTDERGMGYGQNPNVDVSLLGQNGPAHVWANGIGYPPCDMVTMCFVESNYSFLGQGPGPYWRENLDWWVWADFPVFMEQNSSWPSSESCNISFPKFMQNYIGFYILEMRSPNGYDFGGGSVSYDGPSAGSDTGSESADAITITLDTSTMAKANATSDWEPYAYLARPWLDINSPTPPHPARPHNSETMVDGVSPACPIILLSALVSALAILFKRRKRM